MNLKKFRNRIKLLQIMIIYNLYKQILPFGAACLSVFLFCLSISDDIGMTDDSRYYLFAAESFAEKGLFLKPNGDFFCEWTPLFPFLLHFVLDFPFFVKFNNGIWLFFSVLIWSHFALSHLQSVYVRVLYVCACVVGTPLLLVHAFLWSEPLFIFLLSGIFFLLQREDFLSKKQTWLILGFLMLLLCLQRHLGVPFVLGVMSFGVLKGKSGLKMLFSGLMALCAYAIYWQMSPCAEKVQENLISRGFFENLGLYSQVVGTWFFPKIPVLTVFVGFILLLLFLLLPILFLFRQKIKALHFLNEMQLPFPFIFGAVSYLSALLIFRPAMAEDTERLFAPIYLILMFVFVQSVDFLLCKFKFKSESSQRFVAYFLRSIVIFVCFYIVFRGLKNVIFWAG